MRKINVQDAGSLSNSWVPLSMKAWIQEVVVKNGAPKESALGIAEDLYPMLFRHGLVTLYCAVVDDLSDGHGDVDLTSREFQGRLAEICGVPAIVMRHEFKEVHKLFEGTMRRPSGGLQGDW